MSRYYHRALEGRISEIGAQFPALLVAGPRQVGKTTLLRKVAEKERRYVSLDDPTLRELAAADPKLFLERFPPPVLFDEIQCAPGLLPHLKLRIAVCVQHVLQVILIGRNSRAKTRSTPRKATPSWTNRWDREAHCR